MTEHGSDHRYELSAGDIQELLAELHERLVALARRTGLGDTGAEQLEQHIRSHCTDVEAQGLILGGDVDVELRQLADDAARLLAAARGPC